jgi:hypothetical protein
MTIVHLSLPAEVLDEMDLPRQRERERNGEVLSIIVGATTTAADAVTVALTPVYLHELAKAIRNWRARSRSSDATDEGVRLRVSGPGIDLSIDLPPNVSRRQILDVLRRLVPDEPS